MDPKAASYFKIAGDAFIFTGDELIVQVPRRYERHDLLSVENTVHALGIFEMIIDGKLTVGFNLPAIIEMDPREVYNATIDEVEYCVLKFKAGDRFMVSRNVMKQSYLVYAMFVEFISLGNLPKFLSYNETAFLFDKAGAMTGTNLGVNHSVFEMIYAHLFRSKDDLAVQYRHTDRKQPPQFIELRSVDYGTDSTTAKLVGSYFNDGLTAALVNQSDRRHDLEDINRI